jgi:DNA-binding CsgD family transcriptional regulator
MKETASNDLLRAIREARKGKPFFSPPIAARLLKKWRNGGRPSMAAPAALTSRQTEVVQLIAEGYSSKQIAGVLSVSVKTVEKHRQTVMNKLDIHEIATLTRYAVSTGVVESNPYAQQASHSFKLSPGYKQSIGPPGVEVSHFIWPERPSANSAMDPARPSQIRRVKSQL